MIRVYSAQSHRRDNRQICRGILHPCPPALRKCRLNIATGCRSNATLPAARAVTVVGVSLAKTRYSRDELQLPFLGSYTSDSRSCESVRVAEQIGVGALEAHRALLGALTQVRGPRSLPRRRIDVLKARNRLAHRLNESPRWLEAATVNVSSAASSKRSAQLASGCIVRLLDGLTLSRSTPRDTPFRGSPVWSMQMPKRLRQHARRTGGDHALLLYALRSSRHVATAPWQHGLALVGRPC